MKILFADDDPVTLESLEKCAISEGFSALLARDGQQALDLWQRHRPDLLCLDIMMPRMDGYELLSRLKSNSLHRDIPVVMITSRSSEKHRMRALQMGAADYVIKPYQDDLLKNLIEHLISQPKL